MINKAVAYMFCALATVPAMAHAAVISDATSGLCDILLEGELEDNDTNNLATLLESKRKAADTRGGKFWKNASKSPHLCLNSPGGSFSEGVRLASFVSSHPIGLITVVDDGMACLSACALAFMFGQAGSGTGAAESRRLLHARGQLGFHSIYISEALGNPSAGLRDRAFREGLASLGELLELDRHSRLRRGLVAELLTTPSTEFIYASTVERVGRWGITLIGFTVSSTISHSMLARACSNFVSWDMDVSGPPHQVKSRDAEVAFRRKGARVKFDQPGSEIAACAAYVYDDAKRGVVLDVRLEDQSSPAEFNDPNFLSDKVRSAKLGEDVGLSLIYLLDGSTRIADVARQ